MELGELLQVAAATQVPRLSHVGNGAPSPTLPDHRADGAKAFQGTRADLEVGAAHGIQLS